MPLRDAFGTSVRMLDGHACDTQRRPVSAAVPVKGVVTAEGVRHRDRELRHARKLLCKTQVFQAGPPPNRPSGTSSRSVDDGRRRVSNAALSTAAAWIDRAR